MEIITSQVVARSQRWTAVQKLWASCQEEIAVRENSMAVPETTTQASQLATHKHLIQMDVVRITNLNASVLCTVANIAVLSIFSTKCDYFHSMYISHIPLFVAKQLTLFFFFCTFTINQSYWQQINSLPMWQWWSVVSFPVAFPVSHLWLYGLWWKVGMGGTRHTRCGER